MLEHSNNSIADDIELRNRPVCDKPNSLAARDGVLADWIIGLRGFNRKPRRWYPFDSGGKRSYVFPISVNIQVVLRTIGVPGLEEGSMF